MSSRSVVKDLTAAGWVKARTDGSHSRWQCPTRQHSTTIPDGHRTISSGVVRTIYKAKAACNCQEAK